MKLSGIPAASLLAATKPPVGDPLAFYNVAATVIPVFVLAAIYQANVMESLFDPSVRFFAMVVFLIAAIIGEVSALHVLSTGHPTDSAKSGTALGLQVSGGLLLLAVFARAFRRFAEDQAWLRNHPALFPLVYVAGALALLAFAFRAGELI